MVDLKPVHGDRQTPVTNHGFRRQKLLLFVIASVLVHSLGLLGFDVYRRFQPSSKEADNKPIEFVVVPEEPSEPPPETDKRAAENSVAEQNNEPEKTPTTEELDEEIATEPTPAPPEESTAPQIAPPPPAQPEPIAPVEPAAPPPEPQPEPEPEPVNENPPVLSGSDPVATPEPAEPTELTEPAEPDLAARLSPDESPEPASLPPTPAPADSASSLLGGDYQRTLADDGADAFFSPEALAYRDVLDPAQLDAIKDIDLGAYFAEVKRRVKRNWIPSRRAEDYTTFLTFNIQKNGQITGLKVTQSSGSQQVDRESIEAIQNSAPFAPLPANFPLEALEVKFSFNIYIY